MLLIRRLTVAMRRLFGALGELYRSYCNENTREDRGLTLLRDWLSPSQREQFDTKGHFDVIGCDSGTRYRIYHGTAMNVNEIDEAGRPKMGWCFFPNGSLVAGDVMLAQKIALETFELNALAIANHDGPQGVGFPSRSFLHTDELNWIVLVFACIVTLVWSFFQIPF